LLPLSVRIEGYAIVSEDGMLADAQGIMPDFLKVEADQRFFERKLDDVDVVVHGRHSQERDRNAQSRRRIIVTRRVPALAADPSNPKAFFWNPAGATLEQVLSLFNAPCGSIGVLGAANVFNIFLDLFDVFYLSRVHSVWLSGGRPIFHGVPPNTPEKVLALHGMSFLRNEVIVDGLTITSWHGSHPHLTGADQN
jgi:hypothetical protein